MIHVWLDDERPMPADFNVHVKSAWDAIELLKKRDVSSISLDHDLGEEFNMAKGSVGTGYDVAKWIEEQALLYSQDKNQGIPPLDVFIHTQNPVGKKNMKMALYNANRYWEEAK